MRSFIANYIPYKSNAYQSSILLVPFFSRTIVFETNSNHNNNQLNQIQLKFNSKEYILKLLTAHMNRMQYLVYFQCFCNRPCSFSANIVFCNSNINQSSILLVNFFSRTITFDTNNNHDNKKLNQIQLKFTHHLFIMIKYN